MPQLNDLSRSLVALDQDSTIIAVVELSQSSWLVGGVLPGIERQPQKKLEPSAERLLASRRASANGRSAVDQATLEWLVGLRREQAVRCFAGICRRSPLERRQSQRAGAWMGSDKDGRPFSAGRSASGMRNPGVACHERGRVGAIERRVFLSSTPSCAEPDRGRHQDSGRAAGRVPPHLRHTSRLTAQPDGSQPVRRG